VGGWQSGIGEESGRAWDGAVGGPMDGRTGGVETTDGVRASTKKD
jgi:hypothetical protein